MKKLLKTALLIAIGLIGVPTVQAVTYYTTNDLIIGYTSGSGNDVLYDLGSISALTNGKTWNLSTLLTGRTLTNQYWGVVGNGPNAGVSGTRSNWVTAAVGSTPLPITGNSQFSYVNTAMIGLVSGNAQTLQFATYPVYAGESGLDAASDGFSWNSSTINPSTSAGNQLYVNASGNNPNVQGATSAYFWSELNDGATVNQLGAFTLGTNSVLTYNTVVAGFTATATNGAAPLQVVFSDASVGSGVGTNWLWSFGDGHSITNTTSANVTNTYAAAGSYTVSLIVTAAGAANTNQQTAFIVVTNGAVVAPVAGFAGTPTNGAASLQVVFTNTSTGSFTNSVWNFGDTHTATNTTGANVTNTYAAAGSYTVTLTVVGAGGTNALSKTNYIVVTNAVVAPVAGFAGGPTNGFASLQVVFTNTSTGSFTNSVWNFGDTHTATNTTGANVTNTYAAAGSYTVTLTVVGAGGTNALSKTSYIAALATPKLITTTLSGGKLVFNCTNSPAQVNGVKYRIWSSTNLTVPLTNWVVVWSNAFPNLYTNNAPTNASAYFRFSSP